MKNTFSPNFEHLEHFLNFSLEPVSEHINKGIWGNWGTGLRALIQGPNSALFRQ